MNYAPPPARPLRPADDDGLREASPGRREQECRRPPALPRASVLPHRGRAPACGLARAAAGSPPPVAGPGSRAVRPRPRRAERRSCLAAPRPPPLQWEPGGGRGWRLRRRRGSSRRTRCRRRGSPTTTGCRRGTAPSAAVSGAGAGRGSARAAVSEPPWAVAVSGTPGRPLLLLHLLGWAAAGERDPAEPLRGAIHPPRVRGAGRAPPLPSPLRAKPAACSLTRRWRERVLEWFPQPGADVPGTVVCGARRSRSPAGNRPMRRGRQKNPGAAGCKPSGKQQSWAAKSIFSSCFCYVWCFFF